MVGGQAETTTDISRVYVLFSVKGQRKGFENKMTFFHLPTVFLKCHLRLQ